MTTFQSLVERENTWNHFIPCEKPLSMLKRGAIFQESQTDAQAWRVLEQGGQRRSELVRAAICEPIDADGNATGQPAKLDPFQRVWVLCPCEPGMFSRTSGASAE